MERDRMLKIIKTFSPINVGEILYENNVDTKYMMFTDIMILLNKNYIPEYMEKNKINIIQGKTNCDIKSFNNCIKSLTQNNKVTNIQKLEKKEYRLNKEYLINDSKYAIKISDYNKIVKIFGKNANFTIINERFLRVENKEYIFFFCLLFFI